MKTFRLIILIFIIVSGTACQQLIEPEYGTENTITSIECVVVMESKMNSSASKPEDVTQKFPGTIATNGIISFTGLSGLTDEQKKQARFSAIVPLTAKIIEKDGSGNIIGNGIGGQRTISKKTYYFYVVAANGDERKYVITFN